MRRLSALRLPGSVSWMILFSLLALPMGSDEAQAQGMPCDDYAAGGVVPFADLYGDLSQMEIPSFYGDTARYRISYLHDGWAWPGVIDLYCEIIDVADPYAPESLYWFHVRGTDEIPPSGSIDHVTGCRFLVSRSYSPSMMMDVNSSGSNSYAVPDSCSIRGNSRYIWSHHPISGLRLFDAADLTAVIELDPQPGMVMPTLVYEQLALQHVDELWTVVDLTDPAGPVLRGDINLPDGDVSSALLVDDLLFMSLADGAEWTLRVLNLGDLDHPTALSATDLDGRIFDMSAGDGRLYFSTGSGIMIYDIDDPTEVGTLSGPFGGVCSGLVVRGSIMYAKNYSSLVVYDVSDPTAPIMIGSASARGTDLSASGRWLVMGGHFLHFDCNDPLPLDDGGQPDELPVASPLSVSASQALQRAPEIRFSLDRPGEADLSVYDLQGRRLAMLVSEVLPAGSHIVTWDGRDGSGRTQPAGVYLARLRLDDRTATCKLTLIK